MKQYRGHKRFYELLEEIKELHNKKNQNYAKDQDPLSNLRACKEFGVEPWIGVLIRLSDKWSRLQELAKGKKDLVGESVVDTLTDTAIYSLLCIILFEESQS